MSRSRVLVEAVLDILDVRHDPRLHKLSGKLQKNMLVDLDTQYGKFLKANLMLG